ncbi:MAG: hypothetical protein IJ348_00700 [Alistipes sp.]|nr:hypothetical protein [Alistipes sp.]
MRVVKGFIAIVALACSVATVSAQDVTPVPHKVENVTLKTLAGEPTTLPSFGEKNIFFFYIDPDIALGNNKNYKFSDEVEASGVLKGENIFCYGVLNLGDTGLPRKMVRNMSAKRTAKNNATVLDDSDHILSKAWGLGDCNGKCALVLVNKAGELVYFEKNDLDEAGRKNFYKVIEQYR